LVLGCQSAPTADNQQQRLADNTSADNQQPSAQTHQPTTKRSDS
jgi:hypothetical protein